MVVSGHCAIGDNCFIGVNATLRDGIRVGNHSILGAGTLILHDTMDFSVYKGKASESEFLE